MGVVEDGKEPTVGEKGTMDELRDEAKKEKFSNKRVLRKQFNNELTQIRCKKLRLDPNTPSNVIKLRHLPYGFFEEELLKYFRQFGTVRRVRVSRNKKTGNHKGFAFVMFDNNTVAQIAAEAMDNYVMFEKVVRCHVLKNVDVPDFMYYGPVITKQPVNYRTIIKHAKAAGCIKSERVLMKTKRNLEKRAERIAKNLRSAGIEYACKVEDRHLRAKEVSVREKSEKRKKENKSEFCCRDDVKEEKSEKVISKETAVSNENKMNHEHEIRAVKTESSDVIEPFVSSVGTKKNNNGDQGKTKRKYKRSGSDKGVRTAETEEKKIKKSAGSTGISKTIRRRRQNKQANMSSGGATREETRVLLLKAKKKNVLLPTKPKRLVKPKSALMKSSVIDDETQVSSNVKAVDAEENKMEGRSQKRIDSVKKKVDMVERNVAKTTNMKLGHQKVKKAVGKRKLKKKRSQCGS